MKLTERFKRYISIPETSLLRKFRNIILGVGLYIGWSTLIMKIYENYIPEVFGSPDPYVPSHSLEYIFIENCILAPLFEEAVYRLPLSAARNIPFKGMVQYCAIISSVLFGLEHWGGNWTVPMQGVLGLLFCWVYIKNGYSYLSSVLMHSLINLYIFLE